MNVGDVANKAPNMSYISEQSCLCCKVERSLAGCYRQPTFSYLALSAHTSSTLQFTVKNKRLLAGCYGQPANLLAASISHTSPVKKMKAARLVAMGNQLFFIQHLLHTPVSHFSAQLNNERPLAGCYGQPDVQHPLHTPASHSSVTLNIKGLWLFAMEFGCYGQTDALYSASSTHTSLPLQCTVENKRPLAVCYGVWLVAIDNQESFGQLLPPLQCTVE